MKILLITPPFTQLNTPYPATAYLKPVLAGQGHHVKQIDLGILTFLDMFSSKGLYQLYNYISKNVKSTGEEPIDRFVALKNRYINTIDPLVSFLQGNNSSLAYRINSSNWLPEGDRQEYSQNNEISFSDSSVTDKARHKATLYLEEIGDIITNYCDPHFGFSRYGERISLSPPEFSQIKQNLTESPSFTGRFIINLLKNEISTFNPELCAFSIPFPGNLIGALICADYIKKNHPSIKTAVGGGYINTELRNISECDFFNYFDFMTLDGGERPLLSLTDYINGLCSREQLKRTFLLNKDQTEVEYINSPEIIDIPQKDLPAPDYRGLMELGYLSLLPVANKMHRLWSEGKWNKMTLAHGCYWHRCAFCDTSLDYIKRYKPVSASILVDRIEKIISETNNYAFHFVDEAAPPALLKNMAIELIKRDISITWWTNIRFEKSFKPDLCRLLSKSGCIAISGGLEVASDRLLNSIDKGVTVKQVTSVAAAFHNSGIMVHTYLMYGFPGQTESEIINAHDTIRQMFYHNLIDSAYWHQFALTAHSPAGINPESFGVKITGPLKGSFARNDLFFESNTSFDPYIYSQGLKTSLDNYMSKKNLTKPVHNWYNFKTPKSSVDKKYISKIIKDSAQTLEISDSSRFIWTGSDPGFKNGSIYFYDIDGAEKIKASDLECDFIRELIKLCNIRKDIIVSTIDVENLSGKFSINFDYWLGSELFSTLSTYGLLVI